MTDEEATALGKRVVACRHFRPMRGMLDMQGRTWDASLLWRWSNDVDVPDLRDPATLGCVLALVREAWDDDAAYVMPWYDEDGGYTVCVPAEDGSRIVAEGDDEAETLVVALEDAP